MGKQALEKARHQWQSAADRMPQLICLLDGTGHLIHTNRTVERWGLGSISDVKGVHLHATLHPDCTDPQCYFNAFWLSAAAKLAWGARTECAVFDPVLKRHLSVIVQPLVRPPRQFSEADDLHAVVMMGDVSDIKQAEAGYQHLYEELECIACREKEQRVYSKGMQARLLAILEKTTDYVAMADGAGGMACLNPDGCEPDEDIYQRLYEKLECMACRETGDSTGLAGAG